MMARELEVDFVPQGTLIERIRAGGHGLGGILTQTGILGRHEPEVESGHTLRVEKSCLSINR
jgi:acyl CoA:acetate/3-ketoacid CoA transferase alpha subunit